MVYRFIQQKSRLRLLLRYLFVPLEILIVVGPERNISSVVCCASFSFSVI